MGNRLLRVLAATAFMLGMVLLSVSAAAAVQKVPDQLILNSTLWPKHTKGLTKFAHKKHQETYKIACTECHHLYKNGKNTWKKGDKTQKCQKCHNEPTIKGEKKLPKDAQKLNLKLALHNNCTGCHKALKKKNQKKYAKIPTTCVKCHPNKK